jgi:predicted metal-dependent hydrolase
MTRRKASALRLTSSEAFKSEVLAWAVRLRVTPNGVHLQRMTKKWGSCSRGGRLCFAIDLVGESPRLQTVVIVHELLHLAVPNHGKLFRSLMSAYVPGWHRTTAAASRPLCGSAAPDSGQ